jgi:hypothetical protein
MKTRAPLVKERIDFLAVDKLRYGDLTGADWTFYFNREQANPDA